MKPSDHPAPFRARASFFKLISAAGLALLLATNVLPFLLIVRQAFTPPAEQAGWPLPLLPAHFSIENLGVLWASEPLLARIGLSAWVAFATTLLALLIGFPAGWGAARWKALEGGVTRLAIAGRILPPIAVAIPLAALLIPTGLYDHAAGLGLIAAHLTLGLPIALLVGYAAFRDTPPELEEAAQIDGCGPFSAFLRVVLPSAHGSIAAAAILIFLLSWDELPFALLIQLTRRTLPPLILYYTNFGELGLASALALLMLLPAVLVIAALQRLLTRGILASGMKE